MTDNTSDSHFQGRNGRFSTYPTYKSGSQEWVGKTPPHWEFERAKFLFKKLERSVRDEDEIVTAFRDGEVTLRKNRRTEGFTISSKETGYQGVREGDLVIHQMDGFKGAIGVSDSDGKCSPVYSVCQPLGNRSAQFYAYVLRHMAASGFIESLSQGIRQRSTDFRWNVFKETLLPVPSPAEQKAIAAFLDRETEKIDALIEKKEQLIELLEEKRTALISQAVTKGLDPDVPMKESGIEWLGEVPEHWDIARTKFVAQLKTGHTPDRNNDDYWENCTIPWFTLSDVHKLRDAKNDYINQTEEKISELGLANSSAELLPAGTVILSRTASVGHAGILKKPMATSQDFINWICGDSILPEYLLRVFRVMSKELSRMTMGSTHQTIYMSDVQRFVTPLPPKSEQEKIVQYIDEETNTIDDLKGRINEAIRHLKEYRTALISAAVTGKIDVRKEVDLDAISDEEDNSVGQEPNPDQAAVEAS